MACKHGGRLSSCKYLAAGKPCTDGCRCKGCCNPFGVRPPKLGKRKRSTHPLQNVATTSNSFLLERDIATAHGSWSDFETIVFIRCVKRLETNMIEYTDSAITYLYNAIVEHLSAPYCMQCLPQQALLRHKDFAQCATKLQHFKREKQLFQQYCEAT